MISCSLEYLSVGIGIVCSGMDSGGVDMSCSMGYFNVSVKIVYRVHFLCSVVEAADLPNCKTTGRDSGRSVLSPRSLPRPGPRSAQPRLSELAHLS